MPKNLAFAQKFRFGFPLLCDTDRKVGLAYGAATDAKANRALRITYVIDPGGKIATIYFKVSETGPAAHPQQVLDELSSA